MGRRTLRRRTATGQGVVVPMAIISSERPTNHQIAIVRIAWSGDERDGYQQRRCAAAGPGQSECDSSRGKRETIRPQSRVTSSQ